MYNSDAVEKSPLSSVKHKEARQAQSSLATLIFLSFNVNIILMIMKPKTYNCVSKLHNNNPNNHELCVNV